MTMERRGGDQSGVRHGTWDELTRQGRGDGVVDAYPHLDDGERRKLRKKASLRNVAASRRRKGEERSTICKDVDT